MTAAVLDVIVELEARGWKAGGGGETGVSGDPYAAHGSAARRAMRQSRDERKEDTGGTRWRETARTTKRTTHPLIDAG